mgnify:CR=1 FL=1
MSQYRDKSGGRDDRGRGGGHQDVDVVDDLGGVVDEEAGDLDGGALIPQLLERVLVHDTLDRPRQGKLIGQIPQLHD